MLESMPNVAVSASFVAGMAGSFAIRRARHLEGKLTALWRQLIVQAGALAMFAVGVWLAGRANLDLPAPANDDAALAHQLTGLTLTLKQRLRDAANWPAWLAFLGLCAVPSLLHVLGELRTFVLHQRTDLLARDQAAAADRTAPRPNG